MPQRILGIDVGSHSIKVAEIERSFRSFQLVGFFEQPIVPYETLGKEGSTTQALLRLFEEYNLAADLIYVALPGQLSAIRVVNLPFSEFKKIDQTIEFEIENYVPLPLEDLLIDYQILDATKTSSAVLVSYLKKSDFVKFLNMVSEANLDPRFVGSEPVEMANIMKLGVVPPEGAYAIVDLGHEKTNVMIFIGPHLQYARTIMLGGKELTHAIAESLNIPPAEAERMKVELGQVGGGLEGADATTQSVSEAIQRPLEELLLHLRQTFSAFQERKGEVVQALILCGGTSRLPGIDHFLSSRLRKNVSFLDCLDFPFNQLADSNWCRSIAATALSLAYRGVAGSGIKDIQFRRGEFAYKGEVREVIGLAKQAAVLIGVTLVMILGTFVLNYASLKGRAKNQLARIAAVASEALPEAPKKSLSSPTSILSMLTGKITEAEEKQKKVEEELKLSVLNILREFSSTLPAREALPIDVDDLSVVSKRIRVQGRTSSFEAVDQIKTALAKSKMFKNVATENVKKGVREEIRFSISVELSEGETEGT
jgi:general secretion pathway protein L